METLGADSVLLNEKHFLIDSQDRFEDVGDTDVADLRSSLEHFPSYSVLAQSQYDFNLRRAGKLFFLQFHFDFFLGSREYFQRICCSVLSTDLESMSL